MLLFLLCKNSAILLTAKCCWCHEPFTEITVASLRAKVCPTKACQNRQLQWAIGGKVGKRPDQCWYVPLPRQVEAMEAVESGRYRWILFGGALGGSKSHFLRWLAYRRCLMVPSYRALLLRRTYPELEKTHMREAEIEGPKIGANVLLSRKPPIVEFPRNSILEFGHCQDAKNVSNYLSAEYDLILFDELVTFEEKMVALISTRARTHKEGVTPQIVSGTNPGGVGGLWVRDRWLEKNVDKVKFPGYRPEQYHYIPSLLDDNPYLDEAYVEALADVLEPEIFEAYRHGNWDIFEGQYFREFRKDKHVRHLEIPADLPRIGGLDWGYAAPGCHLWAVSLPDGGLHIEREYKFKETIAQCVAEEICKTNRDHGLTLSVTYADPSMWIRSGQSGESIAETFQRSGVPLQRSNHERVNGWQRLRHWLRDSPTNIPWLTIDPDCQYLIRTLPTLVHDDSPGKMEDVNTEGDDHAADALRYLVMGRPAPFVGKSKPDPGPDTAGALLRELLEAQAAGSRIGIDNIRFK